MACRRVTVVHTKANYDDEIDLFRQELNNQYYLLFKYLII